MMKKPTPKRRLWPAARRRSSERSPCRTSRTRLKGPPVELNLQESDPEPFNAALRGLALDLAGLSRSSVQPPIGEARQTAVGSDSRRTQPLEDCCPATSQRPKNRTLPLRLGSQVRGSPRPE